MAEGGQLSLSPFKKQFDDQLTCSVCLDQYTNPKTLPCLHSFCLECIEQIPVEIKDGKYCISCPTCRVDHLLPQGGANSLPNAFHINSFLDLRKELMKTEKATPTQSHKTTPICPKHNDPLKVYCETCCQVICRDCTISTEHNKHTFYLISECYPKHHQQILGNLDLVKQKLDDMDSAMLQLATSERELLEQGDNVKEQINTHAQQLIDNIQRSRTHLTQQVDTIVQMKTQTLATQRQQAQKLHTQLKTCQDMIEQSLKEWNQQQILTHKEAMMDEMNTATQHVDPTVFQPIEDTKHIVFNNDGTREIPVGTVTSNAFSKVDLQVSPCLPKQPSTATLTLHSHDGSPFSLPPSLISSTLSSPGNKHSVKCPITQTQPGKYNITFTPSTRNDRLIVQVGGVGVPDSPFTLPVVPTLEMRGKPVNVIEGLHTPWGIAVCDNGDIVVAEHGAHCITILNKKGERVKTFGTKGRNKGQFNSPRGVAVSKDGHILVTDDHRLQKLTTDGVCVKSVGSIKNGCGQLQFHCPIGITVHPTTGRIFVADSGNNRIQVFNNDLTYSHSINLTQLSPRLTEPGDITIDNEGYLYATEWKNYCIIKLTYTGMFAKQFSSKESALSQLSYPSSLTIHNNQVYVCEWGNKCISVFDTDGVFCHQFGGGRFLNRCGGIAMDTVGNLYVSDTNRIVVF